MFPCTLLEETISLKLQLRQPFEIHANHRSWMASMDVVRLSTGLCKSAQSAPCAFHAPFTFEMSNVRESLRRLPPHPFLVNPEECLVNKKSGWTFVRAVPEVCKVLTLISFFDNDCISCLLFKF